MSLNSQAMFQPGFAGTNAQGVRQSIGQQAGFNAGQAGFGGQSFQAGFGGGQQSGFGFAGQSGYGAQAMFQPGFAGTNAQRVRQDIQREAGMLNQGGFGAQSYQSGVGGGQQSAFGMAGQAGYGAQSMFQPGFAGTNAQSVRQDIQREAGMINQGGFGAQSYQSGVGGGQQSAFGMAGQAGYGAQSMFQPGFAGTNAQQVRQDIAQEANGINMGQNVGQSYGQNVGQSYGQNVGQSYGQNMGQSYGQNLGQSYGQNLGQSYGQNLGQSFSNASFGAAGAQSMFQPGFAGTNVQQVRQDIAQEAGLMNNPGSPQQSSNVSLGYGNAGQSFGQNFSNAGFGGQSFTNQSAGFGGQSMFQPGFAGTNAQNVRQEIAQDIAQGQYTNAAQAGFGGQSVFQPGFAGTNAQQVRQDIAQETGYRLQ